MCAFPVYTAQALGCSAGNFLRRALDCMPFPGLRHSGSGSWVLHKGTDLVGTALCACPRSEQLRWSGAWRVQSPPVEGCDIASSVPAARFSGCTTGAPSQVCRVSLLGSWSLAATLPANVDRPEPQEVLVSNKVYLECGGIGCLSGAAIAPFWLWLTSPACLQWGMGWSTAS